MTQHDLEIIKGDRDIRKYYDINDETLIIYVIFSNGLLTRSEQDNGYSVIVVKEDCFGTIYPAEYLNIKDAEKKYQITLS